MKLHDAVDFARTNRWSVLTTIRGNGLPQLSNVAHYVGDDGVVRISVTASRAKYHNLLRRPWAALHVTRQDFFAYVVLEGAVELSPVAGRPDDDTVAELIAYYRALSGEHEDWDAYRAAMVTERGPSSASLPNGPTACSALRAAARRRGSRQPNGPGARPRPR